MMGVSGMMPSFGDGHESGGGSGGSSEVGASGGGVEESGGGGGNRWPRPETLALLRIRSEMDGAFRDSSLKGPLWEEVSRKLAELGFRRSAKKCKEKFENVFKYHKRTKDGRASKSDGKTYRFFDQLEALENAPPPPPRPQIPSAAAMSVNSTPPMPSHNITVSSTSPNPNPINSSTFQISHPQPPPLTAANANANSSIPPPSNVFHQASNPHFAAVSTSSSSTSSDEDIQRRRGKKRKWKDFFHRLMKDVIHKQEDMQKKFLEALEKRERDRLAREEAWRVQEIARMNREHEFLVQERSIAAAKDAAVIAFLQKVSEQNNLQIPVISNIAVAPPPPPKNPQPPPQPTQLQLPPLPSPPLAPPKPVAVQTLATTAVATPMKALDSGGGGGGGGVGDNSMAASSSRWPKAEIQALIDLRTSLDLKYQENGPKGPLWDEISAAMAKLGYNRSSKRCKEKWENINKYYKKVKEGSKKRPEDSKTCPYFHQLDAIYRERAKHDGGGGGAAAFNPENPMAPIMAMPERQWPLHDQHNPALPDQYHDNESENNDHDGGGGGGGGDGDDDEEDEEDEGGGYEIVTNKQPSSAANAAE